ncbi:MAG TPA: DUF480 domain-containing protein [Planctomycetaceae bacterium]|jgi:uncharacterized protein YceH (UPF0502 family)|nr:DUF480 domain-containing protein [Planctomycetaceae bacterium]
MADASPTEEFPPLKSLTRSQRRVLGTLIEKGITVPESYPLTVKALTAGCNQKSNREPITNYSEDDVLETLEELRGLGLAAVVHTESGRTERFRHYLRRRMSDLTEPQVAVLAELLLRGRQPAGDLRARASRMAPAGTLDSLDQLRHELSGLQQKSLIQTDGGLDRRGVEIDHNLYEPEENRKLAARAPGDEPPPAVSRSAAAAVTMPSFAAPGPAPHPQIAAPAGSDVVGRIVALESSCAALRTENRDLRAELESLREGVDRIASDLQKLRESLGA